MFGFGTGQKPIDRNYPPERPIEETFERLRHLMTPEEVEWAKSTILPKVDGEEYTTEPPQPDALGVFGM